MPQEIRRYAGKKLYVCRPGPSGVWYVHWSDNRRSKRQSTRATGVAEAQAFLDEFVSLQQAETLDARFTTAQLWAIKYPDPNGRTMAAWKHLEPVFGNKSPADLDATAERAYRARRRREKAAPSTLRFELSCLRACWNEGVRQRLIASTDLPVLDPLPAPSPPRSRVLKDEEVNAVLKAAEEHSKRAGLFCWLAVETAARRTAIEELRWKQVDFETGMIHYLPEGVTQTRKRKASVPISEKLRPVLLRAWVDCMDPEAIVIGPGTRINAALKAVGRKAGVAGVTPHVFRHTKATRMAARGVPLFHIAGVLGNTVEQVEKTYAKHVPGALADAVNERRV